MSNTYSLPLSRNGQLKEYIAAGVSKGEFLRRLIVVFESRGAASTTGSAQQQIPQQQPSSQPGGNSTEPLVESSNTSNPTSQVAEAYQTQASALNESSSRVIQDLLSERSARLEAQKKEQERIDKLKREAEARTRKAAMEEGLPSDPKKSADLKYALMQKKRQQDARAERERILKRVEDDKVERRHREALRKAQTVANDPQDAAPATVQADKIVSSTQNHSKECAIKIRLFDGSTIGSRFSASGSLRADVRPFIDSQQTPDIPYTFKHVLTPHPNKNISISDEEQTLQSQGLYPSAILILVSIQSYTSAYGDASATGYVTRGISAGYGIVSSGVGLVTGVLGSFLGGGAAAAPAPADTPAPANTPSSNINVRTLRDADRREDQQFYNGNAVSPVSPIQFCSF